MLTIERILAAAAVFVAAHFAMGFINSSAGGSGGSLLFPFATDAPTRWAFGSLDGMLGLLSPVMIGLAGIAVLTFFVAFFSSLGLWVPARDGVPPTEGAEWYFLISGAVPSVIRSGAAIAS